MNNAAGNSVTIETAPRSWIAALRRSQDQLVSLVRLLTAEQLRGRSYHDWTIAEVLGHMGSQAEIFMEWLTAAVEETEPPGREFMQPIWDAWNARSPEEQVAEGIDVNERLVRRFEGLTDDQLSRMHLNLFGMELDGAGLPRLRLAEHAVHTWDIAVALEPTAQIAPDAVALLITTLAGIGNRVGSPQGKSFRLHVQTTAPEKEFSLQVGDEVELTEWTGGAANGDLRIPAEALLRLVYGRLDPDHTPPILLTGGLTLDDLRQIFPGF
jgi:uncharacterized protein (TIGR03083 family)